MYNCKSELGTRNSYGPSVIVLPDSISRVEPTSIVTSPFIVALLLKNTVFPGLLMIRLLQLVNLKKKC